VKISAGCKWYPSIRSTISFTNEYYFSKDFNYRTLTFRGISYQTGMNLWQGTFTENDFTSALNASYYVSGGTQSVPGMGTFREVKMRHFMT
jgi:hypothetical protein